MRRVLLRPAHILLIGAMAPVLLGCGYMWYHAYYIPADSLSLSNREKRMVFVHRLSGHSGLFNVLLDFARPRSYDGENNRECFVASVCVLQSDSARPAVLENRDWGSVDPVPLIDSIVVTCRSTGLREVLTSGRPARSWFSTGTLCLQRENKNIRVEFVATLRGTAHLPLATDTFAIDLVRWESRNWWGNEQMARGGARIHPRLGGPPGGPAGWTIRPVW